MIRDVAAIPDAPGRKAEPDLSAARGDALVRASHDAVVCADAAGRILVWNSAAERLFGHSAAEALGRSLDLIVPEAMRGEHAAGMRRLTAGGAPRLIGVPTEISAQHADGRQFPIEMRLSMWAEAGAPVFGAIIRDISERRRTADRLHSLAHFDQLTQLPNRNLFLDRLQAALDAAGGAAPTTILLVDLDQFAGMNDAEGAAVGDALLRDTALRLKRAAIDPTAAAGPCTPTVARLGGNEFGVLLPGEGDVLAAADMADRLRMALSAPLQVDDRIVLMTASIGVAIAPNHGTVAAKLLANADFALRRAKQDGGDRRQLFQPAHRDAAIARRTLAAELRRAWAAQEFEVFYQPQVRLSDRKILGAEALLRWRHPDRGVLAPAHFLAVLEDSAIALKVGDWVLETACRQAEAWRRTRGEPFRIGVNLFEAQLGRKDMAEVIEGALAATGLPADDLEIEITESVITGADDRSIARIRALRDLGVRLAFDDYGTGYASLSLLKRYPITRLKIDRGFVRDVATDADDAAIVELILTLGARFALDVIAEGVETAEQENHLRRLGCCEAQGYLFGRPMPAAAFEALLNKPPASVGAMVA